MTQHHSEATGGLPPPQIGPSHPSTARGGSSFDIASFGSRPLLPSFIQVHQTLDIDVADYQAITPDGDETLYHSAFANLQSQFRALDRMFGTDWGDREEVLHEVIRLAEEAGAFGASDIQTPRGLLRFIRAHRPEKYDAVARAIERDPKAYAEAIRAKHNGTWPDLPHALVKADLDTVDGLQHELFLLHRAEAFDLNDSKLRLVAGIRELFDVAPDHSFVLVTGTDVRVCRALVRHFGIENRFIGFVTPAEFGMRSKPDPYPYEIARLFAGLDHSARVLGLEDAVWGAKAALRAGTEIVLRVEDGREETAMKKAEQLAQRMSQFTAPPSGWPTAHIVLGEGWTGVRFKNSQRRH